MVAKFTKNMDWILNSYGVELCLFLNQNYLCYYYSLLFIIITIYIVYYIGYKNSILYLS